MTRNLHCEEYNVLLRMVIGTGLLLVATTAVGAPLQAAGPPKLYALIVADTNDAAIPMSLRVDRNNMKRVLQEAFATRPHRLTLDVFDGDLVTLRQIEKYHDDLKGVIQPQDTLLFYYTGHGAADPIRGHCLTFANGQRLFRSDLNAWMAALKPRLAVVLTDCCSKLPPTTRGRPFPKIPPASWPVMDFLLFQHEGNADINGCQEDAFSFCYADDKRIERGGTFTLALIPLLCSKKTDFGDGTFVSWNTFSEKLQTETDVWFQLTKKTILSERPRDAIKDQAKQLPQVFRLPVKSPQTVEERLWLFGVEHRTEVRGTVSVVAVIKVFPATPANQAGFAVGDILTAVDGTACRTAEEFSRSLEQSQGTVTIKYERNGRTAEAEVVLKPVKPKP